MPMWQDAGLESRYKSAAGSPPHRVIWVVKLGSWRGTHNTARGVANEAGSGLPASLACQIKSTSSIQLDLELDGHHFKW